MAKYTGPKHRLARKLGINILDKTSNSLQRRLNVTPGVHGAKRKRKLSEFGIQLKEKQKAKHLYGVLEKQFKNIIRAVEAKKGDTGEYLVAALETRLDNVVYRLGFSKSRFMARQIVGHGHIQVNGKKLTIPSYKVKEGDVITLGPKMQKNVQIAKLFEDEKDKVIVPFLERKGPAGKMTREPKKGDIEVPFDTQLIIEYYSR